MSDIVRCYKVSDVLEAISGPVPSKARSRADDSYQWFGASWQESVDMIYRGWLGGVPKLDTATTARLRQNLRPKQIWDVAGSQVDVGAYLSGVPECMQETVRTRRPSPVVRIGVDRIASCNVSAERIEAVGRNVLVLVEALRLCGIPSEVWACFAVVGNKGRTSSLEVCAQEAGRPVDMSRLAYWLAHPAALRRTAFALWETAPYRERQEFSSFEGRGYGGCNADYARARYEEWAPGPQHSQETLAQWTRDVLQRRAGVTL